MGRCTASQPSTHHPRMQPCLHPPPWPPSQCALSHDLGLCMVRCKRVCGASLRKRRPVPAGGAAGCKDIKEQENESMEVCARPDGWGLANRVGASADLRTGAGARVGAGRETGTGAEESIQSGTQRAVGACAVRVFVRTTTSTDDTQRCGRDTLHATRGGVGGWATAAGAQPASRWAQAGARHAGAGLQPPIFLRLAARARGSVPCGAALSGAGASAHTGPGTDPWPRG